MTNSEIDARTRGDRVNRYGPSSARPMAAQTGKMDIKTVDIHSHIAVPEAAAFAAPFVDPEKISMEKFSNQQTRDINIQQGKDRIPSMVNMEDRLIVNDKMGIDFQIVAPPPPQCYYHIPLEPAIEASRIVNDGVAAYVNKRPDKFAGLCTVPLQDGEAASAELERCIKELGMKGVEVLTSVNGHDLSEPQYEPFWRKAEELGCLVMIHPNGYSGGERFVDHYFSNVIGNPLDTTVALHHLIFDGVLERMPDLKILAVHGGGFLPAYSGRIDHAWGAREDCHAGLPKPPTEYLKKVYFDSVVFTQHQLEYLVQVYGADKIVMGTDYPFDMGEYDPIGHILEASNLSDAQKAMIAGENALNLLDIASS